MLDFLQKSLVNYKRQVNTFFSFEYLQVLILLNPLSASVALI